MLWLMNQLCAFSLITAFPIPALQQTEEEEDLTWDVAQLSQDEIKSCSHGPKMQALARAAPGVYDVENGQEPARAP